MKPDAFDPYKGTKCRNLDSIPIILLILVATVTICFLQARLRLLDILYNLFVKIYTFIAFIVRYRNSRRIMDFFL